MTNVINVHPSDTTRTNNLARQLGIELQRPSVRNDNHFAEEAEFWGGVGFDVDEIDGALRATLPNNVIAFVSNGQAASAALWAKLRDIETPPSLTTTVGEEETLYFSVPDDIDVAEFKAWVPSAVDVRGQGDLVSLPTGEDFRSDRYALTDIGDLQLIGLPNTAVSAAPRAVSAAIVVGNPLEQYSLRGHLSELEAASVDTVPLLGDVVLAGQSTIIYAPPGAGKTLLLLWLLMEAINAGRSPGGNVFYVNADDSSSGVFAKMQGLEDVGAHMLVPGWQGFSIERLLQLMQKMVETDTCRGVIIIVDTLKKSVDLMDKRGSRAFGRVVRECVAKGATFVGLAHTNKNRREGGALIHAGTTDMVEDADAACYLNELPTGGAPGEQVVKFQFFKRRGGNVDEVYAYAKDGTGSYDELLASVRRVDPGNVERSVAEHQELSDQRVIEAIAACIADGIVMKMPLRDAVAKRANVTTREAIKVLERYQGDDPEKHHWAYSVRNHGAKVYRLLTG